jgi:GT2 family glycosyltransferase
MIMKVTIIIINYKCREYLEECLKCIPPGHEVIIVDNQDEAEFLKGLKKKYDFKIMAFAGNMGFAKANNKAIADAKTDYIMTLNADCFLEKGYIEKCIGFLEKNKNHASVQGKLLLKDMPGYIDSIGNCLANTGFAYSLMHKQKDNNPKSREIFGVCAAAAVYRKKALEETAITINREKEYFDSDFFAYLEDVDLDWRLRLRGHRSYFLDSAIAYHKRESTTGQRYRIRQSLRNRFYMVIKNDSAISVFFNLIFYTPLLLLLPNRIKNIKMITVMLKKRKKIERRTSNREIRKLMVKTPIKKYLNIFKLLRK